VGLRVSTCPACAGKSTDGGLCTPCTRGLRRDLRSVPGLVRDLDVAVSRQARLQPPATGGLASERTPIEWNAAAALARLGSCLTTWARDIGAEPASAPKLPPVVTAAHLLLAQETALRGHPAAAELADDIRRSVDGARRAIDKPDRHIDVGSCPEPDCGGTLRAHLPAADDRPTTINCLGNPAHTWTPDQWLRLGRRILHAKGPTT
jgi:hypothetical protein